MSISRRVTAVLAVALALSPSAASPALAATAAVDDAYTIAEDTTLNADGSNAPNVLANDTTDGGTLCVASFDTTTLQGAFGAAADGSGAFTYTPPANFAGSESFTYSLGTVSGSACAPVPDAIGTVTITVTPVNDAPAAVADSFTALKDHTLNVAAPGVLGNDSDVDGDTLSAVKASSPAHGVVTLGADGGFSYTPANGYVGPDAFSYTASDGTAESLQRIVSINVVDLPPTPSPTPIPTPTSAPPTATPEATPTESPAPFDTPLPTKSPLDTGVIASASPSPIPVAGPASSEGGPPIIAIGALALLLGLLAVAALYFVRSQGAGEEAAYASDEPFVDDEPLGEDVPRD